MLKFTEELVVRIWEHGGPGHSAGTIRAAAKDLEGTFTITGQTYISWWPSDKQKKSDPSRLETKESSPLSKQVASPNLKYLEDKRDETGESTITNYMENRQGFKPRPYQRIRTDVPHNTDKLLDKDAKPDLMEGVATSAQHNIHIPGLSSTPILAWKDEKNRELYGEFSNKKILKNIKNTDKNKNLEHEDFKVSLRGEESLKKRNKEEYYAMDKALWGLNLNLMAHWWKNFLENPNKFYRFASTDSNCAGVMMGALMAGGMGAYIPVKKALMYYAPKEVRNYAENLQARLFTLNRKTRAFAIEYKNIIAEIKDKDIWTCQAFQNNSQSKSKYSFRMEQVKEIDACLQSYHKLGDWNPASFTEKLGLLVKIMDNVLDHLEKKPNSDRRKGVLHLGCQVVHLLTANNGSMTQWSRYDNDPKPTESLDIHQHKYQVGNLIYECQKANEELSKRRKGERAWRGMDIDRDRLREERLNRLENTSGMGQHRSSNHRKK